VTALIFIPFMPGTKESTKEKKKAEFICIPFFIFSTTGGGT